MKEPLSAIHSELCKLHCADRLQVNNSRSIQLELTSFGVTNTYNLLMYGEPGCQKVEVYQDIVTKDGGSYSAHLGTIEVGTDREFSNIMDDLLEVMLRANVLKA